MQEQLICARAVDGGDGDEIGRFRIPESIRDGDSQIAVSSKRCVGDAGQVEVERFARVNLGIELNGDKDLLFRLARSE
jgi:hypothetical protein